MSSAIMGLDQAIQLKNGELCASLWAAQQIVANCGADVSARSELRDALACISGALNLIAQAETAIMLAKDHITGYIDQT